MRRIRQVLQLHFGARASARVIAGAVGVGRSTVQDYLARAAAAGLAWPLPAELTDGAMEQLLFPAPSNRPGARRYVEPDWSVLVREMKRPGVNLSVLFDEYRGSHREGYAYSRFCELYRAFERRLSPTMRQTHVAGDKAFVDYSGKKVPIVDPLTGEVRMAELFIAVLGASNLTYLCPRALAATRPAIVRSLMRSHSNSASAANIPKISFPLESARGHFMSNLLRRRCGNNPGFLDRLG